jgi:hypothetical protein
MLVGDNVAMKVLLLLLAIAASALTASSQAAPNKPMAATQEQVRAWVRGLNSDEFATREEATDALSNCGLVAITELQQADLPQQNLEVVARGMLVLQELALSDDVQVEDAARELLEKL